MTKHFQNAKTALLALAISVGTSTFASAADTLRWTEHQPKGSHVFSRSTEWYVNELMTRSGGDLSIDIQYGGVLASVAETPEAIETGLVDVGNMVTPYFTDKYIINNAIGFFIPQTNDHQKLHELFLKWHDEIPQFGEELARYNQKLITIRAVPTYGFICTKPIRTLEDFRGKRVRSYGLAHPKMLEALGAVPVGMSDTESFEALSNNVLDCTVGDATLAAGYQLEKVAKYYIDVPLGAAWGQVIAINVDKYNSLSEKNKQIIDDMRAELPQKVVDLFAELDKSVREKWAAEGTVEVIKFPADEFLKATLENDGVRATHVTWKERAIAAGMSEADAQRVVDDLSRR